MKRNWMAPAMLAMALVAGGAAAGEPLRIGTASDGLAGSYTVAADKLAGFETALITALCAVATTECEQVPLARTALLPALAAGEIDAAMGVPASSAGGDIELTMSYLYPDPFAYVGPAGTELPLGSGTLAVVQDRDAAAWEATSGRTFAWFDTPELAFAALGDGDIRAVFAEKSALVPFIAASDGALGHVYPDQKVRPGLAMAFRAADRDLMFTFEDAIFALSQDGSLVSLVETWFGDDALPG